ncbi:MAG TPA: GntR family transcriptional regulator [Actinomycetota bacterium]
MARRGSLERETTAKVVAERLRDEIQEGSLAPGTRLRQNDIAARFGVSTTPVREAFAQLQAEGLVRIDPHRGAVVFHPTVDDLLEYYEIREALESLAILHAIPNLSKDDSKALNDLIDRMRRTTDTRRWLRMNDEFHLRMYQRANRPHLSALIDNLREASMPYIYMFIASRAPSDTTNEEHQEILDAALRGDAAAAQRAIRKHLHHAADELERAVGAQSTGDDVPPALRRAR